MVAMSIEGDYDQARCPGLRLHEKGGKPRAMPADRPVEASVAESLKAAGIADDREGPLPRDAPRPKGERTGSPMRTADVWRMIRRRLEQAGIATFKTRESSKKPRRWRRSPARARPSSTTGSRSPRSRRSLFDT
jgi:hypothetical protein